MDGNDPKTRAIAVELRRAREATGMSVRALARRLGKAHTTVMRWEDGGRVPRPVDIAAVLATLGARHDLREELVALAEESTGTHWVATRSSARYRQRMTHFDAEKEATHITVVSPIVVPGLLQSPGYARAVLTALRSPDDDIDFHVATRVGRQHAFLRSQRPAEVLAITCEHVLDQRIGGRDTMLEQLGTLRRFAELPNVTFLLVPTETDAHPGIDGPFTLCEFLRRDPLVYTDNHVSSQVFHESEDIGVYSAARKSLVAAALSPDDSLKCIATRLARLEAS